MSATAGVCIGAFILFALVGFSHPIDAGGGIVMRTIYALWGGLSLASLATPILFMPVTLGMLPVLYVLSVLIESFGLKRSRVNAVVLGTVIGLLLVVVIDLASNGSTMKSIPLLIAGAISGGLSGLVYLYTVNYRDSYIEKYSDRKK